MQLAKQQAQQQQLVTAEEKLKGAMLAQELAAARDGEARTRVEMDALRSQSASLMDLITQTRDSMTEFAKYRKSADESIKALTKENELLRKRTKAQEGSCVGMVEEV